MEVNTYLFFNGNCEAAFKYYEKHLGGSIETMLTHEGTPAAKDVPPEWQKKILHAKMTIGGQALMASDAPPGRFQQPAGFSVSLNLTGAVEAERIFHALAENGKVTMPIQKTFWAERFGMLVDQFGIPWMVNAEQ